MNQMPRGKPATFETRYVGLPTCIMPWFASHLARRHLVRAEGFSLFTLLNHISVASRFGRRDTGFGRVSLAHIFIQPVRWRFWTEG